MRCSKRGFCLISFSLFFTVCYAASSPLPGSEGFPPSPPDQEVYEEDSHDFDTNTEIDSEDYIDTEEPDFEPPFDDPDAPPPPPRPPKDADKIFYYRGNRTYSEELPLKVNFIKCIRDEDDNIIIMIIFNQSVNPRTVTTESVLIDDTELPEDIRFSFNRKGDTIRVVIPEGEGEFQITVQNIRAFNGACIEPVELIAKVEEE